MQSNESGNWSREGGELLAAEVLRLAYNDMLTAMIVIAAHRFRKVSYNCAMEYERLRTTVKGKYGIDHRSWEEANRESERLQDWFLNSERCRMLRKQATGEFFVDQAKKRMCEFVADEKPEYKIRPMYSITADNGAHSHEKEKLEKWAKARDKWRKAHGLEKVE